MLIYFPFKAYVGFKIGAVIGIFMGTFLLYARLPNFPSQSMVAKRGHTNREQVV